MLVSRPSTFWSIATNAGRIVERFVATIRLVTGNRCATEARYNRRVSTWMLILAMALVGCSRDEPAAPKGSGAAEPATAAPPLPPPGNAVQTEMRMLTSTLEATVRAIGARDVRPIEQELHKLHAAKEATTAAIRDGSYKLPKNPGQVDAFVAMDEAFHEHLGALVMASRANDVPRAADALGAIVRGCEGCHATFRLP